MNDCPRYCFQGARKVLSGKKGVSFYPAPGIPARGRIFYLLPYTYKSVHLSARCCGPNKTNTMPSPPSPPPGDSPAYVHESVQTGHPKFALHAIMGFALFGLLVTSAWEFGGFTFNEQLYYHQGTHGGNYWLMTVVSLLFEGKMMSLMALAFGAGILLFVLKKEYPVPIGSADAHIRRMIWLMAFGVFNAFILLWPGDMLFPFGVLGILLFAFTRMRTRGFFIAALVCTLVYTGKQYWNYADDKKDYRKYKAVVALEKKFRADSISRAQKDSLDRRKDTVLLRDTLLMNKRMDSIARKNDTLTKKQDGEKKNWEGKIKSLQYDSTAARANRKLMKDDWRKVAYRMIPRSQQKESTWLYKTGIWDIGSMMFLGMALLGAGFFTRRYSGSRYLLIGVIALAAGLALAWLRVSWQGSKLADYTHYIESTPIPYDLFLPVERLLMAAGYAAILSSLLHTRIFAWGIKALAAAGRMALSLYVLQTIICSLFFYGYGFGYFGSLKQWELYFFVAEVVLVQVVFAVFWFRYYKQGPLEWVWDCVVYRKWLPNKRG